VRRLYGLIAVILVLGLVVSCGSRLPGPRTIILGPRVTSVTTPSGLNAGDSFTFVATVTGSMVTSWSWNFGGGANPNTSTAESPTVVLVNPSTTDDATYDASVTVMDADGRSYTYNFTFTVGMTLNQPPVFVGLPTTIDGDFSFSIDDPDGDDVAITLTLVSGDVTVSPTTINATSANYGPFDITVSNSGVEDQAVEIEISLDDGVNAAVTDSVTGTVAGVALDPDTIYIVPSATEVNVGDTVQIVVYVGAIANPLGYLTSCEVAYSDHWTPDTESWNLGAPGGAELDKDGFWAALPDSLLPVGGSMFWLGETLTVNVSALGSPPTGAPAGTSGALFSAEFTAAAAGTGTFDFVHEGTYYEEPDGTEHFFTTEVNASVTIN